MAGTWFGFLDLGGDEPEPLGYQPEILPARPKLDPSRSRSRVKLDPSRSRSRVNLDAIPIEPTEMKLDVKSCIDIESSDSDYADDGDVRILAECPPCPPGALAADTTATHVVLKVQRITGISAKESVETFLPPGRQGLGHFVEGRASDFQMATASLIHFQECLAPPPYPVRPRHCAAPRVPLEESEDSRRDATSSSTSRSAVWPTCAPGEVRVKLRRQESSVCVALVVGGEIIGLTKPLPLQGAAPRFFNEHPVYSCGYDEIKITSIVGMVRIALELWPPGSSAPGELDNGFGTNRDMGLFGDNGGIADGGGQSRQKPLCMACEGLGRTFCGSCSGHGVLVCKVCDGMAETPCGHCAGNGCVLTELEGIGGRRGGVLRVTRSQRCMHCWGSPATCDACFGAGALRCGRCKGGGWLTCSTCGGSGSDNSWY